ncbi:MAG: S53 family peptidase [Jatrophihabitans sp.]|uniref:S53 family peptidase n=1 Tax=Jatrophihabitans sp. TaxID=1932789 RepID=UPI003F7D4596
MPVPRKPRTLLALAAAALGVVALVAAPSPVGAAPQPLLGGVVDLGCANPASRLLGKLLPAAHTSVAGQLTCFAKARTFAGQAGPAITSGPVGLKPADIQSAYKLAGLSASGRTVAIVDAYDDPKAEADLAVYRKTFGLPPCTTANGCFKKVNQAGAAGPLPAGDYGWATEITLDLDAVSAACPSCSILLVEANSASIDDLGTAVNTAARLGASAISNSYGGSEDATITATDHYYNHPGIAVTVSSGDSGYGVEYPASSPYVTGVGGTTLTKASNARGWTEAAWSGAGSGCSAYEPKPSWQHDSGCAKRTVADVSADADPNSGLGIYDTYNSCGSSGLCDFLIGLGVVQGLDGWAQVGGTSLASPLVASVAALHGGSYSPSLPYANTGSLFDVTTGSNGSCGGSYLCTARAGYDGPTGLGTPNGTGAF